MPPKKKSFTNAELERLINQRVIEALAARQTPPTSGSGPNPGSEEVINNVPATKPCTYKDFLSCKPLNFSGTEGAIGLLRWLEKTESVFRICSCPEDCKVKFSTYTFMDDALTWWNTFADSVGQDIALQTPWDELKKMLKDEYCPRDEIQQLEAEFWQLTTQGNDIAGYTSRFNQLAHLCPSMVSEESKRIERYVWGLPPQIQGMVTSSNSATYHGTVRMAHKLIAQIVRQETSAVKSTGNPSAENKRKADGNLGNQSQVNKKPATAKANTSETGEKIGYKGSKPYCSKCSLHHDGSCPCPKCKRFGHVAKDCKTVPTGTNTATPKTCYECKGTGHFKKDCPKLKDKDYGPARGRAYVLRPREEDDNPRVIDLLNTGMVTP